MARWWVFPPRARLRLFYRRDGDEIQYVVRSLDVDPGLNPAAWTQEDIPGTWTAPGPRPPVPAQRWRGMGGRIEELAGGEVDRRYRLRPCPDGARPIGTNLLGEEVREHDGRRWILHPGTDRSWTGDEIAHPPARALRFGSRQAWTQLARRLVELASRGQLSLDDGELTALAAASVDAGRRPSFQPWTRDPAEARRILISELRAALLAPAAESARPQWVEAVALERAIPALARAGGSDPPLAVAAAVAGIAGPLREACLTGTDGGSAWAGLFGGGQAQNAVVDSRRMDTSGAAALLEEQSESRPGRVVSLLPGDPDHPDIQHALASVARRRGIEAVLHLPAEALPGEPDGLTMVAAGLRRPRELAEPPPQALRVLRGEVRNDLRRWLDEGLRGRGRLAGEEEAASRQAPYVPISRIGQAKCTIARCHQTAANVAGRSLVARRGPVDEFVAGLLGTDRAGLERRYSPEQIDAIAMSEDAHLRGRAFLLADQTGTGKGRAAVGMAASWLRADPVNRVVYVTVGNAAADVIRDLRNTGAIDDAGRPLLLGNMPDLPDAHTPSEGERREIQDSREFPDGARFIVTSWSSMQTGAAGDTDRPEAARRGAEWFTSVADDPSTMLVLDEAHCALNPSANLGINARRAVAGAGRVAFVTATALRSPDGVDLYRRLMPGWMGEREFDRRIVRALRGSGETAQESYISMLTEDGVMLRRDHDTGMVPYSVDTPDEAEAGRAAAVMASVSEVAERLMAVSQAVRRWCDDAQALYRARVAAGGRDGDRAARQLESMLTGGFGGPMDQIARSVLVALKVGQASRRAVQELRERGRKPMIAISSTNGEFLRRIHNGEVELPDDRPPDLRDLIRHVAARVCVIKGLQDTMYLGGIRVEGDELDLRGHDADVGRLWAELSDAIGAMPAGLPLSPADALAEELRAAGVSSGEITGRDHRLTAAGEVERREVPRKETVAERYNSGDVDVLIYNEAGGTGASYHASAEFPDQRPRTILQLELPLDVLRHLQSMGRGNRFDQVALPHFITLSTDTLAEQRLLAINNRKLRTVGAILDGDREHPALVTEVPDLFNSIGERACAEIIRSDQALAARLDLHEGSRNLAKSIFTRALLLTEQEQTRLFGLITAEYEAQLAEADARGQNPLKVPSLPGYVEILNTQPYAAGHADIAADGGDSVFARDMKLSTGVWRMPPGLPASAVSAAAVEAAGGHGQGGAPAARSAARDLTARWQDISRGMQEDELRKLIDLLESFEPGRVLRPADDPDQYMVAVEYLPPGQFLSDRSFGHRFRCIQPGDSEIRTWSAAQLMKEGFTPRRQNILDDDAWVAARFDHFAAAGNRRAVQILSGDMLSVAGAVAGHGSRQYRVCRFNDQTGASRRAAVNCDVRKLDLTKLPFRITAASLLDAVSDQVSGQADRRLLRSPASAEQEAKDARTRTDGTYRPWLINLRLRWEDRPVLQMSLPSLSARNMQAFWTVGTGPELFRSATGEALRKPAGTAEARTRVAVQLDCADGDDMRRAERICALIDRHPVSDLLAPGSMRGWWSERGRDRAGARQPSFEPSTFGELAESVEQAGMRPGPAVAARVSCPDGEIVMHALPDPDPERRGSIVTLPPSGGKAGELWSGREGRELFRTVFGKPPAKGGGGGPATHRTVFLDSEQTRRMCTLLRDKAKGTAGWSVDVARPGRAPEAEPLAGIAA